MKTLVAACGSFSLLGVFFMVAIFVVGPCVGVKTLQSPSVVFAEGSQREELVVAVRGIREELAKGFKQVHEDTTALEAAVAGIVASSSASNGKGKKLTPEELEEQYVFRAVLRYRDLVGAELADQEASLKRVETGEEQPADVIEMLRRNVEEWQERLKELKAIKTVDELGRWRGKYKYEPLDNPK